MTEQNLPSPELLRKLLHCEASTGKLFWLQRPREMFVSDRAFNTWNSRFSGREAFLVKSHGYLTGRIFYKTYRAHRVIWAIENSLWPKMEIDHINGDRSDNRICNLREVTSQENNRNLPISSSNTSGVIGVCWSRRESRWRAHITIGNRHNHIGYFDRFSDAVAARKKAEEHFGFHVNHGRKNER